jgi:hypothetical protein
MASAHQYALRARPATGPECLADLTSQYFDRREVELSRIEEAGRR